MENNTTPPPEGELSEEFHRLGENIKQAAQAVWQSEESQKLKQEIRSGLRALEAGLSGATAEFTSGEAGQRIKSEVQDFSARVRSGQVENQMRQDLLTALRAVNAALQKSAQPKGPSVPPDDMV
jgi:uncharacterized lipoprotein YmbA